MSIPLKEVEQMIYSIRECDELIYCFQEFDKYQDTMQFCVGTKKVTRDAMVGGLIERRTSIAERLTRLGIDI